MKCTLHRCQLAPGKPLWIAATRHECVSEITNLRVRRPPLLQLPEELNIGFLRFFQQGLYCQNVSLTWLWDRLSIPRLLASLSILRVDTSCTNVSCTTWISADSLRLRSVTKKRYLAAMLHFRYHEIHSVHSGIQPARRYAGSRRNPECLFAAGFPAVPYFFRFTCRSAVHAHGAIRTDWSFCSRFRNGQPLSHFLLFHGAQDGQNPEAGRQSCAVCTEKRTSFRAGRPVGSKTHSAGHTRRSACGISTLRAALLAGKALIAALAAGGWVAVVVVLILCLLALVLGSCFGVFSAAKRWREA